MNSKYYLAVIATFVIYGFFSLPLKAIDEYPSLDILLSRLSMASVLILIFSFVFRRKITFEN
ncbi:MAG: EamA family transporter, partial [Flavobacteriia bacterium]|nr:EamA family transporter [Flavobacteriia bacterium]